MSAALTGLSISQTSDSAFGIQQAAGGVFGYSVQEAFRYGVARGLFSNDAGAGPTPSMHASAMSAIP